MPAGLEKTYDFIEEDLDAMEGIISSELTSDEPFLQEFLGHFRRYRGKRIRPALLFLFGRAFGRVSEAHVRVAAAAELIHVATLIHDDILDEASVRRKVETANRLWGNERSVLLGDWVFARAFEMASRLRDPDVISGLVKVAGEVCQGEMLQICHRLDMEMGEERYLHLIRLKTGSLFGFCCAMGAGLSGAGKEQVEASRLFGENLGVAFQIVDDCLDISGREEVVGKSLGTDMDKGKMTLPFIHALRSLAAGDRSRVEEALRGRNGRMEVITAVREAGSLDYSRRRAVDFASAARSQAALFDGMPLRPHIESLADFVVDRPL